MAQTGKVSRRQVGVDNDLGLHLRVANSFVKLANTFQSEIQVQCKGIIANGKSILGLLSLAAESGTVLALEAHGCDAEDAVAALARLITGQSNDPESVGRGAPVAPVILPCSLNSPEGIEPSPTSLQNYCSHASVDDDEDSSQAATGWPKLSVYPLQSLMANSCMP